MSLSATRTGETTSEVRNYPGDSAMWIFVLGDLLIFSSYFIVYAIKRIQSPALFLESQRHLNLGIGVFNTVALLTSSWFIAQAVQAAREGKDRSAMKLLGLCMGSGVAFVAVKAWEWISKIVAGQTFTSSEFFSFYYFFTGIHLIHLLLGLGILGLAAARFRSAQPQRGQLLESAAIYWHMVDLLWVAIFALLYLMR